MRAIVRRCWRRWAGRASFRSGGRTPRGWPGSSFAPATGRYSPASTRRNWARSSPGDSLTPPSWRICRRPSIRAASAASSTPVSTRGRSSRIRCRGHGRAGPPGRALRVLRRPALAGLVLRACFVPLKMIDHDKSALAKACRPRSSSRNASPNSGTGAGRPSAECGGSSKADPEVVEEWKWMGTPVWSHDGNICTGESYRSVVKLTFAKGHRSRPPLLFNSSLDGNVRRAIDIHEGEQVDEPPSRRWFARRWRSTARQGEAFEEMRNLRPRDMVERRITGFARTRTRIDRRARVRACPARAARAALAGAALVLTVAGRAEHLGTLLPCRQCDEGPTDTVQVALSRAHVPFGPSQRSRFARGAAQDTGREPRGRTIALVRRPELKRIDSARAITSRQPGGSWAARPCPRMESASMGTSRRSPRAAAPDLRRAVGTVRRVREAGWTSSWHSQQYEGGADVPARLTRPRRSRGPNIGAP